MERNVNHFIVALEDVFRGNTWYGTSIWDSLNKIPLDIWNHKVSKQGNSIAELVGHIIAWRLFVIEKLKGNATYDIELNSETDWKSDITIRTSEDLTGLLEELKGTQATICQLLQTKNNEWLSQITPGKTYNNRYMIQGLINHDCYHLGQINLIHSQAK